MISIRAYEESDLAACRALWVALTQWHRDIYDAPEIGGEDPGLQFDAHLGKVGSASLWVAVDDGTVVGLVGLMRGADDDIEIEIEIEPLVVATTHRGQGIGRRLVNRAIEESKAAGFGTLSVCVVARNERAIQFYADRGFRVLGTVELFQDFREGERPWRRGEHLAGRDFLV